ncbi:hypothetical protein M674_04020 [Neisseria gonorrhoeae SK708]|nr:hypothetical protein M674_04020 [Neisseria gonorrhoeae SK708]
MSTQQAQRKELTQIRRRMQKENQKALRQFAVQIEKY